MKIEVKKTVETTEIVEVEFPLYRKIEQSVINQYLYFKALDEYIEVREGKYSRCILNSNCHRYDGILVGMEITEAEFIEAYNRVQNELTIEFHNQFSKKNAFIKNESIKSDQLD